jgi:two-component sensor histidine kinase/PAS domain-containing protein
MIRKGYKLRATTLLGFVFVGLSAVSLAAVGLFSAARLRRELRYGVESSSRLVCAALAHELSTYLSQHAAALELAAAVGDASLDALRELYPAVERAFVVDERGVLVAPRSSPEYGFDLSSTEFFRQGYVAQRYYVSSSFVQDGQYEPTVAIYKALPNGMNAVAYLNLGAIGRYVAELPTNGRGAVAVLGRRGTYIAHPDAVYIGQRRSAALETWFPGRERPGQLWDEGEGIGELVSWHPVSDESRWTVVYRLPLDTLAAAERGILASVSAVALTFLASAAAFSGLMLYATRRDLERLLSRARSITKGDYTAGAGVPESRFQEFASMGRQLGAMAEALAFRERALQEDERRMAAVLDFMPVPLALIEADGSISLMNKAMRAAYGWTKEDAPDLDAWWPLAYPDPDYRAKVRRYWDAYLGALATGSPDLPPFSDRLACKDGGFRLIRGQAALIGERVVVVFIDVTEATEAAQRTMANLAEKEVLLKEIHHRVKNNLQMVASLLALSAESSESGARSLVGDSLDRIQVMATIHELLYQSEDLAHIQLDEYVRTIASWLVASYAADCQTELALELETIPIDIDRAIPCGLILNELLTNAMKYAFRTRRVEPRIRIRVALEGGEVVMAIADNGGGMPPGFDPERTESLGMQLVLSLCQQLKGRWSLDRSDGTAWEIRFPG